MTVWKRPISVELLTLNNANSAVTRLGIEFLEVGDDFIRARVPVDERTRQPYGLLHGGVGSSRVDLQACKLEYSIVSPK